ncbi:hypothetical protein RD792_017847, partial [Penstemon davidsonii]
MWRSTRFISSRGSFKLVRTSYRIFPTGASEENKEIPSDFLRNKKLFPYSDPPSVEDVNLLYEFIDRSSNLVILTGAGISTESGIPDYRSPNGAYSTGFRPITHQVIRRHVLQVTLTSVFLSFSPNSFGIFLPYPFPFFYFVKVLELHHFNDQEFLRSNRARRRYWARSYAGWRRFTAAQPGPAHIALASLEKAGHINFMMTQNVDRLHHRAGSNPLELHGTVYVVACTDCGFSLPRISFQDQVKDLNPKWAEAIERLDYDTRSDNSFGVKQRPDGDIEINEKFWEEEFHIPNCEKCNGILKPDVVFFGDNVPKGRADKAMEAAKECDAFLVLGSSLMTMSAFRLIKAAHEAGAATAIVNVGVTRADDFVPLKINARLGEV